MMVKIPKKCDKQAYGPKIGPKWVIFMIFGPKFHKFVMCATVAGIFCWNLVSFINPKDYFELGIKIATLRLFLGPK